MRLRVKGKTVWFEGEEAHRHSLVSNTSLQAGASGFTAPSRVVPPEKDNLFWSPWARRDAVVSHDYAFNACNPIGCDFMQAYNNRSNAWYGQYRRLNL